MCAASIVHHIMCAASVVCHILVCCIDCLLYTYMCAASIVCPTHVCVLYPRLGEWLEGRDSRQEPTIPQIVLKKRPTLSDQ